MDGGWCGVPSRSSHVMRALQCAQFGVPSEVVRVVDMPLLQAPAANEVTIAVAYASVSHATSLLIEGRYQSKPPMPFVPGTEAVGHVVACGAAVTRLKVGDAVMALARWGCYAEQITVSEHTVYPLPKGLSLLQALPLPLSYGTAYTGLQWRCALQPGETVLVLGAGAGVGLAAVELAVLLGAEVIACASTPAKRAEALARGAHYAVAPDDDFVQNIKAMTAGRGADVVVDPVGGDLFDRSIRAAAQNARILSVGFASGRVPQAPLNLLLVKNITLHGFFFGRYLGWTPHDERVVFAPALQQAMHELGHWALQGRIRPTVSAVFPITGLTDALAALESRQIVGKIALQITPVGV